jgi:hypothetical protein
MLRVVLPNQRGLVPYSVLSRRINSWQGSVAIHLFESSHFGIVFDMHCRDIRTQYRITFVRTPSHGNETKSKWNLEYAVTQRSSNKLTSQTGHGRHIILIKSSALGVPLMTALRRFRFRRRVLLKKVRTT